MIEPRILSRLVYFAAVAERFPAALTMRPSGLFAGARPIASIADHSWRNAKRITELTGQPYTVQYHDNILRRPQGIFDSIFATRAIVALGEIDPTLGPALLDSLQTALTLRWKIDVETPAI